MFFLRVRVCVLYAYQMPLCSYLKLSLLLYDEIIASQLKQLLLFHPFAHYVSVFSLAACLPAHAHTIFLNDSMLAFINLLHILLSVCVYVLGNFMNLFFVAAVCQNHFRKNVQLR